ncbi:MAG: UvrD-helicase domain-containing protein [Phycisphaerales bacterium]|nr:UvrD-helicase domain-containing protein [Phycisphaerales bacterium]
MLRLEEILSGLNPPQREAVTHVEGPLLIVAGPGSGKTRVVTRRLAHLVLSGVAPRNILAITFTNKAADELRRRVMELGVPRGAWVHTFHALGARLLGEFGPLVGVQPGFSIYDEADQLKLVKDALEQCSLSEASWPPNVALARISAAKNRLLDAAGFAAQANDAPNRTYARVFKEYEKLLQRANALDFDDLLLRPAQLLRDHPDVAAALNDRFRHVMVDEYQDTNHVQYVLARQLSQQHGNLCVTGDPDQSIYGWRGADIRNILDFEADFRAARVIRLEQNYRSSAAILEAADALIHHNRARKRKTLWTENPRGEPVNIWRFDTGFSEADRIAAAIVREAAQGRRWSDFAIMYRVNALSRTLEDALRNRGVPYRIARGVAFYGRKEVKDAVAYLRLLVNPADDAALLRVINTPTRGIGKTTIERLARLAPVLRLSLLDACRRASEFEELRPLAAKLAPFVRVMDDLARETSVPLATLVDRVIDQSGLAEALRKERDQDAQDEDRAANVAELVSAAARFAEEHPGAGLVEFLQRTSLIGDQDTIDPEAGAVQLLTLHAAKGLEFPWVFLVGVERGLLPHERALSDGKDGVEEERRLCFVGMTRAMQHLVISHARQRLFRGATQVQSPSQFLREIDAAAVVTSDYDGAGESAAERDSSDHRIQRSEADRRIQHSEKARGHGSGWRVETDPEHAETPSRLVARRSRPADQGGPSSAKRASEPNPTTPYADWKPGTLLEHPRFGVGALIRLEPVGNETRAVVKFAGTGEKSLIIERTSLTRLAAPRKPRAPRRDR